MESSVTGVVVLVGAGPAHGEARHRRVGPVVREPDRDREARSAIRAVDERVAVAAVVAIEQLAEAVVAYGDVGSREGAHPRRGHALGDAKRPFAGRSDRRHVDGVDASVARCLRGEPSLEGIGR
jgi:hypothetical protein